MGQVIKPSEMSDEEQLQFDKEFAVFAVCRDIDILKELIKPGDLNKNVLGELDKALNILKSVLEMCNGRAKVGQEVRFRGARHQAK